MDIFDNLIVRIILLVLSLSSLLVILEAIGFLPNNISRWLNRNRNGQTISLLKELGFDISSIRRHNIARSFPDFHPSDIYSQELSEALKKHTIDVPVKVGKIEPVIFKNYWNIMGATTKKENAIYFARFLSTHLKRITSKGDLKSPDFSMIACPKSGSPFLAYELANLINKPLILHLARPKFQSEDKNFHALFDFEEDAWEEGATILLVDDSTTGGRMVLDLTKDLRLFGYTVTDCLVLFEPQGKDARAKLESNGVHLHTVIQGPISTRVKE